MYTAPQPVRCVYLPSYAPPTWNGVCAGAPLKMYD